MEMVELESNEAWEKLLKLAIDGNKEAQFEVAMLYESGARCGEVVLVSVDEVQALEWYRRSHDGGNVEATVRVADYLSEGQFCDKDELLAIELYKKAIEEGCCYAAGNVATVYRDQNDFESAFECHSLEHRLGPSGSIALAHCYHFGIGTKKDKLKALEIFRGIANDESEFRNCAYVIDEANFYLGLYYLEGEVVERSVEKARLFLMRANEDDDHRSATELLRLIGRNDSSEESAVPE